MLIQMEALAMDTLLYAPPLVLGVLITLYRNNILCFWDCHPVGISTKEFVKDVAVKMSDIQKIAVNVAVALRNVSTTIQTAIRSSLALVAQGIRSTALMIVNRIQGILVTIQQNFQLIVFQMKGFLTTLLNSFHSYLEYLRNTTVAIFTPKQVPNTNRLILVGLSFLILLTILWLSYRFLKTQKHQEDPVEKTEEKPRRYPIRRRSKPVS